MHHAAAHRPLALVTGASSGIGRHLALLAAEHGYDLLVAADTPLDAAVHELRQAGARVQALQVDLASSAGVDELLARVRERDVDTLMANAGHGLGGAFLDQEWPALLHVVNTNVTGTLRLVHAVGRAMCRRHAGRILITGSVAGMQPGSYEAVYAASKAFVDSFAIALRDELRGSGVSVTCLMPGPTDTEFFARAGLLDTRVGRGPKSDPAKVARVGFEAVMRGEADAVAGWFNRMQAVASKFAPNELSARRHGKLAQRDHHA